MEVKAISSFKRDVKKLKDKKVKEKLAKVLKDLMAAKSLSHVANVEALTGTRSYYRIKVGDYRLGIHRSGNVLELVRFLHRKDIYNSFP